MVLLSFVSVCIQPYVRLCQKQLQCYAVIELEHIIINYE